MNTRIVMATLFVGMACVSHGQPATSNRIALVIGAQNYSSLPPLRHPLNDAMAMTTKLKSKGFQVEALYDPRTKKEVRDAITRYYNAMRDQVGAVGLIFYAGHGMQYEGDNYIIPTTASLQNPGDLEDQCVKMNTVMAVLKSANKSLNILLLDACRSLPSFTRDTDQGLTRMEAPQGSIIVFAAQAGKVASDGTGQNGLFTSKLMNVIDEPNLNITEVFKRVKQQVYAESGEQQLPSVEDNSIGGDFYFTNGITAKRSTTAPFDYGYGPGDAPTLTVGSQVWLGKNLNVGRFNNGDLIPEAETAQEWENASANHQPAWSYYNNDPVIGRIYGKVYNWYALNDPRGLAPKGWHIPSDAEWTALSSALGGEIAAGTRIKSNYGWENDGNGNNNSGFAGMPGGYRFPNGQWSSLGKVGAWWSSTESDLRSAWVRNLIFNEGKVTRMANYKDVGLSVRCIKD